MASLSGRTQAVSAAATGVGFPQASDANRLAAALTEIGMELAPPPAPGSRIQELGDRLLVPLGPSRSWGAIAFLTVWVTLWTFGGIAAFHELPSADWSGRAFLLFWLGGWALGEGAVVLTIAWQPRVSSSRCGDPRLSPRHRGGARGRLSPGT